MDKLNRGELAEMFGISTAQLRHYEDSGLIKPEYIAENGYRKYGKNEMYRLAYILYLREFDLPIKKIKKCIEEYNQQEIMNLLYSKKQDLEAEILRLQNLVNNLDSSVEYIESGEENTFSIAFQEKRHYKIIFEANDNPSLTARKTYELLKETNDLYKTDFTLIYHSNKYYHCIQTGSSTENELVFSEGKYLTYRFSISENQNLIKAYYLLIAYAKKYKLYLSEMICLTENSLLSIINPGMMYYKIEAKVEEKNGD